MTIPAPIESPPSRIPALDVVRGVALVGILLMNVEFFNRPLEELGNGLPPNLSGIDRWAGWLVYVLVQGKFWTMFSLLFGMGFAVMLTRAQQASRPFLPIYLRRTVALFVLGALHHVFLWGGDILVSYAVSALALLWVLRAPALAMIGATLALVLLDRTMKLPMTIYLAYDFFYLGAVSLLLRVGAGDVLSRPRTAWVGAGVYLLPFVLQCLGALGPRLLSQDISLAQTTQIQGELSALQSYGASVAWRFHDLVGHLASQADFATILVGMFLLGAWFIRSGLMQHPEQHLTVFKRLALWGIPIGVGLGLAGSMLSTYQPPDIIDSHYRLAEGLMMVGNLPACLGYVGLVVWLLHRNATPGKVVVFAPLGRMALTNYITHSLVGALVFYPYGLGMFGTPRAWQVVFAFALIALQIPLSAWWLSRFTMGPLEWLWRAATYWKLPVFVIKDKRHDANG